MEKVIQETESFEKSYQEEKRGERVCGDRRKGWWLQLVFPHVFIGQNIIRGTQTHTHIILYNV